MSVIINGTKYQADKFAYDGCHKIYLIESAQNETESAKAGYPLYNIEKLPDAWEDSCPLRFISTWDLDSVVPQGYENDVVFEFVN